MKTYGSLPEFAQRFPPEAVGFVKGFDLVLRKLSTVHVAAGTQIRAPQLTGALLASQKVRMPASGDQFGVVSFSAPYASVYIKGRRRSKPHSRKTASGKSREYTRMLGSRQPQARRGMVSPALRQLRADWSGLVEEAVQRIERGAA